MLSAAGFFPNAGAIPDVLNAGISALRGRPEEARESLTAAIPYAGDLRKANRTLGIVGKPIDPPLHPAQGGTGGVSRGAARESTPAQTNQGNQRRVPEYPREKVRDTLPKEDRPTSTNNNELGKWAEDQVDTHLKSQGWERVGGNTGKAGAQGIDGVYKRTNENGEDEYIVVETKYNTSDYEVRKDGTKQMSDEWIEDNLPKAVQDDDTIIDIQDRGYTKTGYRVFPDGSIYKEQAPH